MHAPKPDKLRRPRGRPRKHAEPDQSAPAAE
jgi:hypothetical protein